MLEDKTETEMSFKEFQQLLIDGKITENEFTKILIDNIGAENFMKIIQETLQKAYGNDLLTKSIPEGIDAIMRLPE